MLQHFEHMVRTATAQCSACYSQSHAAIEGQLLTQQCFQPAACTIECVKALYKEQKTVFRSKCIHLQNSFRFVFTEAVEGFSRNLYLVANLLGLYRWEALRRKGTAMSS